MADNHTGPWGRREFLQVTGAAGAVAAFGGITAATPGRDPGPKENELLVGISASTEMATAHANVQEIVPSEAEVAHRNDTLGYLAVRFPERSSISADSLHAERLRRTAGVKYVEKNATHHAFATPDDSMFDQQYAPQQVRAPEAWDTTEGSSDVTIAVVDQGVKYDHPDLEAQFGSDKGKDFVDSDQDPMPDSMADEYHGTHVAGIASATTNNGTGVAGMSDSTIISGRSLSEEGSGSTSDIADAVQWAADQGADIINMSLGGGGYTDTMKNAVSYAVDNGALPICANGNDSNSSVSYPAAYEECIGVSAVDENEALASFSNYGPKTDVAAPGVDILSCWTEYKSTYGGKYNEISGTSMACPATSGVAALGLAANPGWSVSELRSKLKETAVDIGLSSDKQGSGRVDAANLVGAGGGGGNEAPSASFTTSPSSPNVGETVSFDASGSTDSDGSITSYEWDFGDGTTATGQTASHSYGSSGTYSVTLTVTDDKGATDSVSKNVSVGTTNAAPSASFTTSPSSPKVDETVTFDASGSTDSDGSITSYEWDFGDGTTATGETVTHSYGSAGDYTVSLTVTDDAGATDTVSKAITVESSGGGDEKATSSADGSLYGYWDSESYTYTSQLSDPYQLTISLDGDAYTDFDLYVTTDGRTPSTWDYDKRSVTLDSQEQVVIDGLDAGQEFGILVDSYEGSGGFTVTVEELGN
jgi:serine protease